MFDALGRLGNWFVRQMNFLASLLERNEPLESLRDEEIGERDKTLRAVMQASERAGGGQKVLELKIDEAKTRLNGLKRRMDAAIKKEDSATSKDEKFLASNEASMLAEMIAGSKRLVSSMEESLQNMKETENSMRLQMVNLDINNQEARMKWEEQIAREQAAIARKMVKKIQEEAMGIFTTHTKTHLPQAEERVARLEGEVDTGEKNIAALARSRGDSLMQQEREISSEGQAILDEARGKLQKKAPAKEEKSNTSAS